MLRTGSLLRTGSAGYALRVSVREVCSEGQNADLYILVYLARDYKPLGPVIGAQRRASFFILHLL